MLNACPKYPGKHKASEVLIEMIELGTQEVREHPTPEAQEAPTPVSEPQPARKPVQTAQNRLQKDSVSLRK